MARVILVTDFTEAYARRLLLGIARYAHDEREAWSLSRMSTAFKERVGVAAIAEYASTIHADAIIGQFEETDDLSEFEKRGIVVLAQDYKTRFKQIPNITANHFEAGEMGARYFLKKGFNHFGFFGPRNVVFSDERYKGFKETIKRQRPSADISSLHVSAPSPWGYDLDELRSWIAYLPKPVAIMASDDNFAYYITEACQMLKYEEPDGKYRIPEDIAVLGVDNDETICQLSSPNLSSIDQDVESAGYKVARLIKKCINNPEIRPYDIHVVPTGIVTRQSSDILVNDDPHIATVLKYINDNLSQKLSVDEISAQVPMSRRLLENRFRKKMGTSIYNYIIRNRVERMAELLKGGASVSNAAYILGFEDIKNVSRLFKNIMGVSPSEYRRQNS